MIRVPKIYLYREDGSSLWVGSNPGHMSVSSFSYTEAEGTGTDILNVKLNVSESYYSFLSGITMGTPIYFSFGYVSWQCDNKRLLVDSVKSTYGSSGYIVELICKPTVDVESQGNANGNLEDIFDGLNFTVQVKAREEFLTTIQKPKPKEGPRMVVGGSGLGYGYGSHSDYLAKNPITDKAHASAVISANNALHGLAMDQLKEGRFTIKDGKVVITGDNSGARGGVTSREDKIIMLADQANQVAKPSHSFYPNSSIINVYFTSKDKANASVVAANGTIDPDDKSASIDEILTSTNYTRVSMNIGTLDETVDFYEDNKTGNIYFAVAEEDGSKINLIAASEKQSSAIGKVLKKRMQDRKTAAKERSADEATSAIYTKEDGTKGAAYANEFSPDYLKDNPDIDLNSSVRTDINIQNFIRPSSYITHPKVDVDPATAIHSAIDNVDLEGALIGAIDDANFYRNSCVLKVEGKPTIVQGQTIQVGGFATVFSGLYLIRKVVHSITASGYTSTITSTKVPDTYEMKLEKAKATYGKLIEKKKEEAFKKSYDQLMADRDALNKAIRSGAVVVDTDWQGLTTEYATEQVFIMDVVVVDGDKDTNKNWRIVKNPDGKVVSVETKEVKVEGKYMNPSSKYQGSNEVFISNQHNINSEYHGDELFISDGPPLGGADETIPSNEATQVIIKNNNP